MTTTWPAGIIARYLTVGGATVDLRIEAVYYDQDDPKATVAICAGCENRKVIEWVRRAWDYSENGYVDVVDEGGERSTAEVREWAQTHAEKCRAMPRPDGAR